MSPDAYLEMAEVESRHWWFIGRRIILAKLIADFNLPSHTRILEIGSGTGGNLSMLARFGQVSAIEMNATAHALSLEKTGDLFDVRLGSCPNDIPFKNEKFDLICLFDVLEHIDQDVDTLLALKDLLTPHGRILITVPAYQWLWSAHDEFLHHRRRYSANELQQKVISAGFKAVRVSYFNTLLFPIAMLVRLKDKLLRSQSPSGNAVPPIVINRALKMLFGIERFLLTKMNLPFGVSLMGVLQPNRELTPL